MEAILLESYRRLVVAMEPPAGAGGGLSFIFITDGERAEIDEDDAAELARFIGQYILSDESHAVAQAENRTIEAEDELREAKARIAELEAAKPAPATRQTTGGRETKGTRWLSHDGSVGPVGLNARPMQCSEQTANEIAAAHNSVCDAYEARITELEAAQVQPIDAVSVKELAEIAISAYLKNEQAARENAGVMVDPMRDAVTAILRAVKPQAAQTTPAVTPEWLAKAFRDALASEYANLYDRWEHSRPEIRDRFLGAACIVVKQMPAQAPVVGFKINSEALAKAYEEEKGVFDIDTTPMERALDKVVQSISGVQPTAAPVVDMKRLLDDYHADGADGMNEEIWTPSLERALEVQGISCK